MRAKYLNFNGCLSFYRIIFFSFFLLCFTLTSAQQTGNSAKIEPATIVLKNGAKIFSTDETFNKQVNSGVVLLKNADLIQEDKKQDKILEASSSKPEVPQKDFKQELKTATEKKQKEELKKVKKEIDQYEVQKKAFQFNIFKGVPSSEEFLASNHTNKDSVPPGYTNYDFSETILSINSNTAKTVLYFLHPKKYTFYNNISLGFCFSEVFSVRPPPSQS